VRPELETLHSQVLQDVLKRVQKAFDGFFRRLHTKVKAGYPRFAGHNRYDSFTYPQGGWSLRNHKLTLSKIGTIKLKLHREVIGKVKTCTIKREGSHWYVCFSVESEITPPAHTGEAIGIDVGLENFANFSNGEQVTNPRYFRKAEKHLAKVQKRLAKEPKTSPKRKKLRKRVSNAFRRVKNQRQNFLHQTSARLVKLFSLIVVEKLQVSNLSKRPKPVQAENGAYLPNGASAKSGLNKSIADAGWSIFTNQLAYKVAYTGSRLVKVDPKHTSQICPQCGAVAAKSLYIRWHSCPCGCEMHRDIAAAKVILRRGLTSLSSQSVDAPAFKRGE
jgi:putative transposase